MVLYYHTRYRILYIIVLLCFCMTETQFIYTNIITNMGIMPCSLFTAYCIHSYICGLFLNEAPLCRAYTFQMPYIQFQVPEIKEDAHLPRGNLRTPLLLFYLFPHGDFSPNLSVLNFWSVLCFVDCESLVYLKLGQTGSKEVSEWPRMKA